VRRGHGRSFRLPRSLPCRSTSPTPLVGAALVAGVFSLAVAIVNGIVQIIGTWLQTRSKKPPSRNPKPRGKKHRRWRPSQVRPPPQDDVVIVSDAVASPNVSSSRRWCTR